MGQLTNISINFDKIDQTRLTKDKSGNLWLNLSSRSITQKERRVKTIRDKFFMVIWV